ncbi:ATP-dependent DNA helicase Q4 [Ixodes scapularis]|uniref:ATP-dependent DNA helicase Q4 n=1 Tax=Ixodes scapularis TaxID=6945 RepID=UPI001A9EA50B|nr:ATP-dependent DNA helicase Q4 [Ixodes scapularis]
MTSLNNMQELKAKIKAWEKKFATEFGRKPTSADIKESPPDVLGAYIKYWKTKRSSSEAKPSVCVEGKDNVWSHSLNKTKTPVSKDAGQVASTSIYERKIKAKLFASFDFDFQCFPRKSTNSLSQPAKSGQDEATSAKQRCQSEGATMAGERCSLTCGTVPQTAAGQCHREETADAVKDNSRSASCRAVVSPVKGPSIPQTLYYKKSLDDAWLSRNSQTDEVFVTPSQSSLPVVSRLLPNLRSSSVSDKVYVKSKVGTSSQWSSMSQDDFDEVFLKSPVAERPDVPFEHSEHLHTARPSAIQVGKRDGLFVTPPVAQLDVKGDSKEASLADKPAKLHSSLRSRRTKTSPQQKRAGDKEQVKSLAGSVFEFVDDSPKPKETKKRRRAPREGAAEKPKRKILKPKEVLSELDVSEGPKRKRLRTKQVTSELALTEEPTGEVSVEPKGQKVKTKQCVPQRTLAEDDVPSGKCSRVAPRRAVKSSLQRRVEAGTVNENFVRIDLKRKRFSRGHHKLNVRKLKFKEWKQRKNGAAKGNTHQPGGTFRTGSSGKATSTCFKCGLLGHWARSCPGNAVIKLDAAAEQNEQEVFHLPTLEEAAEMARGVKLQGDQSATPTQVFSRDDTTLDQGASGTDDVMPTQSQAFHSENASSTVQPLLEVSVEGKLPDTPEFVFKTLHKMGFSKFRPGQEAAIMRILSGMSTLLVSSTGSGKSLCYQIPAYLYAQERECITLVVSPLISLMEDQVVGLPPCLKAAFLHSGMPPAQKQQVLEQLKDRSIHFLLVSPESLVQSSSMLNQLPPVAFACIDEAHCLSEWSHNFRPSYLQLYKILTTKLKVRCILALTATATRSTCLSIAEHLCIEDCTSGIIGTPAIPDNLVLSISEEEYRDEALIALLKGSRLGSCESIIVYCTRREETERLASLIRTSLQSHEKHPEEEKNPKGPKSRRSYLAWDAEAYHAGLTSFRRRSIQKKFMTGKLRVVVATVAFGMGIDKADIRAIIHYNMPKSFESYVQEAGRAGRDGLTSHCHLFLEPEGRDQYELKRHIYANSTDRHVIRKLLKKIFSPLTCQQGTSNDGTTSKQVSFYEVAIPIDATVEELDMKEENILTLICFLEFHPKKVVQVFNKVYATCTLKCYGGPQQLRSVASKNAPVAAAMALARQKGEYDEDSNSLSFAVVDVASYMGWDSKLVKKDLKNLEWDNSLLQTTGHMRKSGVIVEFSDLSFHLSVAADLSEEDRDDLLDYLYDRVNKQERMELQRLKQVHAAFQSVAYQGYFECVDDISTKKSDSLKQLIHQYFNEELDPSEAEEDNSPPSEDIVVSLQRDIRSLVGTHRDHTFNGRAVARIFHGIASPCFPAQVWGRVHRFWRSNLDIDFNAIVRIANRELVSFR